MSNADNLNPKPSRLVLYSAAWCPDCKRSKTVLDNHKIDYLDVDIGKDNDAFIFIEKLTRRVRIPTLIFPDGTILIEPSDEDLLQKLGPPNMSDLYTYSPSQIVLYGIVACGDCRRARQVLDESKISYLDIDIDHDSEAADFVMKHNRGFRSAPTIVFPDGSTLTEPNRVTLTEKLQAYKQTA